MADYIAVLEARAVMEGIEMEGVDPDLNLKD